MEASVSPMSLLLHTYPYLLTHFRFPEGSITFTTIWKEFQLAGHAKDSTLQ